jgi:hypothetical protein
MQDHCLHPALSRSVPVGEGDAAADTSECPRIQILHNTRLKSSLGTLVVSGWNERHDDMDRIGQANA